MTDTQPVVYDPSIGWLLDQCVTDWGDPVVNRQGLVPYGIGALDKALYGIDTYNGEMNVVMGPQKSRKTTFIENVLINYMTGDKPATKPFTAVDSLESGMHPRRYRDTLIANLASRHLLARGHVYGQKCPACGTNVCRELVLSPEFLRYYPRSIEQQEAITYAMDAMRSWPLHIYGANPVQGDTRNIASAAKGQKARWLKLIQEHGAKIFIIDHVQQYSFDTETTDYEKQLRAVATISDVVAQWNVVFFVLSQVSLTSVRESRSNGTKITAAGGTKAQQEANVVIETSYSDGANRLKVGINESRKSGLFSVWQQLEPTSGAFFGVATKGNEGALTEE